MHRKLAADPKDPPRVEAAVGDQLQLRVTSKRPATLELVRLGPTEDVDPAAPALFDVLLDRKGTFKSARSRPARWSARSGSALELGRGQLQVKLGPVPDDPHGHRNSDRSGPMRRWSAETSVIG